MLASRLMTRGVFVLAALMIVVGLICVNSGVAVVRMEIGWTEVIGGAVAASAGCVVLVMGLVLLKLEAIRAALARGGADAPILASPVFPSPVSAPVFPLAVTTVPDEAPAPIEEQPSIAQPAARPLHPLSPAARREPPPVAEVRPEPPLAALLHPEELNDAPPAVRPSARIEEPALSIGAPALVGVEEAEAARSPPVPAPDRVADPVAEAPPRARPSFLSSLLARRPFGAGSEPQVAAPAQPAPLDPVIPVEAPGLGLPAQRSPIDLSSGWDEDEPDAAPPLGAPSPADDIYAHHGDTHGEHPDPAHEHGTANEPPSEVAAAPAVISPTAPPEPELAPAGQAPIAIVSIEAPHAATDPLQPVVVGRYNAGAASYVMYSNGMIEVETEAGTHQFASMQELKSFIEKRDMRVT